MKQDEKELSKYVLESRWDNKKKWKKPIATMWQKIFEDPQLFANYYYEEMYPKNRVYTVWAKEEMLKSQGIEEEQEEEMLCGMIHLNPYEIKIQEDTLALDYIVGVAVDKELRRQGIMSQMLQTVMKQMRKEGKPFTFLMPAKEEYYTPFDFRFVYERYLCVLEKEENDREVVEEEGYQWIPYNEIEGEVEPLLSFCEKFWEQFQIASIRTKSYFEQRQKELEAEHGSLLVIKKKNEICGYAAYAMDQDTMIFYELVTKEDPMNVIKSLKQWKTGMKMKLYLDWFHEKEKFSNIQQVPSIMFRILDVEKMLSFIRSQKEEEIVLELEDSLLEENSGIYRLNVNQNSSKVEKILEPSLVETVDGKLTIAQLTEILFGYPKYKETQEAWKRNGWIPMSKIYLSEIV